MLAYRDIRGVRQAELSPSSDLNLVSDDVDVHLVVEIEVAPLSDGQVRVGYQVVVDY